MTNIALIGCTGSIGRQTLDIVERYPDLFRVTALVCGSDAEGLAALKKPSLYHVRDRGGKTRPSRQ